MLAGILLIAVLWRTAAADPEASKVHPTRVWGFALAFTGHSGAIDGVPEGGLGPTLELALGGGRTQYFVEGGPQWISLGRAAPYERGIMLRGGVGARYIARSFEIGVRDGAVEMIVEGLAGVQKIWFDEHAPVARPELGLGLGFQMRKYERPGFVMRMSIRLVFAPAGERADIVARATEESSSAFGDGGIMFSIGGGM